jgi:glycerophosphoryl diester phosphodiesterase
VAAGRSTWPLLSSFDPLALDAARRAAPELPRALLADSLWTTRVPAAGYFAPEVLAAALAEADAGPADPPDPSGTPDPTDPSGPRAGTSDHTLTWLAVARGLGCVACVLNHQRVDAALIERLHGLGLRALVYTVNDPARAAELLAWGLDGVITDAVDRMVPAV